MIRPFERGDLPAVVGMHRRVFGVPRGPQTPLPQDYAALFFDNPWFDPEIRSLVFEKPGAGIVGFVGVVARPMRFEARAIRIAVPTRFMQEPGRASPTIGAGLLRALLSGPQEATIVDGANEATRRLFASARAELVGAGSLHWQRPLRPAAWLRRRLDRRGGVAAVSARLARPLCAVADALIARGGLNGFAAIASSTAGDGISAARLLPLIERAGGHKALRPVYDPSTLGWLLGQLERMGRHRLLRGAVVCDGNGREVGWYLCYLQRGDEARVLQLVADPGAEERVLASALMNAREQGAILLRGRVHPDLIPALARHRCAFSAGSPWTLIHSALPELRAALQRGDALFSSLEGEWW